MILRAMLSIGVVAGTAFSQISAPIKWACIGNSITYGMGADTAYPIRLSLKLGTSFTVQNDGVSSTTLLKKGDDPYWKNGDLGNVFNLKPDIITIMLGTNDSKSQNWSDSADFVKDFTALVDTVAAISSHPQIWLMLPTPCFANSYGISGPIIKNSEIPRIEQVANAKGLSVIDLNTPLQNYSQLFPDGVHPNDAGADSIAAIIYRAYAAKAVRIACIGNSITQYNGILPGYVAIDAYASKLGMLLGRGYLVHNDGVSGTCMQKARGRASFNSYWDNGDFADVFAFKPQIITIMLGTNDSRPQYWNTAWYMADGQAMIDTLSRNISPKPTIWAMRPLPAWQVNGQWPYTGINGNTIRDSVVPAVDSLAAQNGLRTIDLYTPFNAYSTSLLTSMGLIADGVHPNAQGEDTIAHIVYRALTSPVALAAPVPFRTEDRGVRLVAVLSSQPAQRGKLYSLDGKAMPFTDSPVPMGIYVLKPQDSETPIGEKPNR